MAWLLVLFSAALALVQWLPWVAPRALVAGLAGAALLAAAAALALAARGPRQRRRALAAVLLAAALSGAAWSAQAVRAAWAQRLPDALDGVPVGFDGWVADLPQPVHSGLRLLVETAPAAQAQGLPARLSLLLPQRAGTAQAPAGGDCLHVEARLQPVHGELNFAGFDLEGWLWSSGIAATGKVLSSSPCRAFAPPAAAAIQALRDRIRRGLRTVLGDRPAAGIVVALAVGDQGGVTPGQWTLLWRSGIGHLVSISGVHVTLLASLVRHLAEWLWQRSALACRRWPAVHAGAVAGFLVALAYALVAGFGVPTRRTLFMLAAASVSRWAGRVPGGVRVFWLAVAVTLAGDPPAALSPSFWLSFGAVGGLVLAGHGRLRPLEGWRAECSAQWVSNLCLLPLIALWFGQLSLVAPLANLVAIPLVGTVVTPLSLAAMFPGLHQLALPAEWLLGQLLRALDWLAAPAWAAIDLAAPAPPALALALASTAVLLAGPVRVPGATWALLGLLPLWLPPDALAAGALRIEVVDVGQGLAVLARTRHHLLVFDSGPRWSGGDAGSRTLLPLLRAEGLQRIDLLVLSHPDADHVGGAESLLAGLPVGAVQTGFGRPGSADCLAGQSWDWDGVQFDFLWPPDPGRPGSGAHLRNNHACVLRVRAAGHSVLLPADIEAATERALLADPAAAARLHSDVVVVAHHGSHTSSTADWVAATGARCALISLGWRNRYHHPDVQVVTRWEALGAQVLRTDRDGAIRVDLGADGIRIGTARAARPAWWR